MLEGGKTRDATCGKPLKSPNLRIAGQNPKYQSWDSGDTFAALGTYLLGITEGAAG